ncbi:MAG TPA: hypothetical protein VJ205_01285, partial [Gammaproteobacteria bacterium]|nr:hypothetical protein [Gammaproteobacteria bacterium]
MPTMPTFDPKNIDITKIGASPRASDTWVDTELTHQQLILQHLDNWLEKKQPSSLTDIPAPAKNDAYYDLILSKTPYGKINIPKAFYQGAKNLVKRFWDSGINLLTGRRWKTNLLMLGLATVAVGAVVALCIFAPPIGAAAAAIGSALTLGIIAESSAIAFGIGTAGLGLVAAISGFKLGEKFSDRFLKKEKYEITNEIERNWKNNYKVEDPDLLKTINVYLLNRIKNTQSKTLKKKYQLLYDRTIKDSTDIGLEKLAQYFIQELVILRQELDSLGWDPAKKQALEHDYSVVKYIMTQLAENTKCTLAVETKTQLTIMRLRKGLPPPTSTPTATPTAIPTATPTPASKIVEEVKFFEQQKPNPQSKPKQLHFNQTNPKHPKQQPLHLKPANPKHPKQQPLHLKPAVSPPEPPEPPKKK